MKKVLFLIEIDSKAGAGKCALEHIQMLHKSDSYEPIVITQHRNDINTYCDENGIENHSVHYARICSIGLGYLGWLIAFISHPFLQWRAHCILKKKIDFSGIALCHSNGASIDLGAFLFKKYSIPHIWHIRDFFLFNKRWIPLVKDYPKYLNDNSTKIITVSNRLKDYCQKHGCNEEKVITIHDGVLASGITSLEKQPHKDILKVICLGELCEAKGQKVLLNAITRLNPSQLKHFYFDFYGTSNPKFKEELLSIINENSLQNNVSIHGFITDPSKILQKYDIGIQPSHSEGFSRVTVEYMLAGLCTIATREIADGEPIIDSENGLLFGDNNDEELYEKILFCLIHQDKMTDIGHKAKIDAQTNYCYEKNFNEIKSIYDSI